jgi:hypothetical protein
MRTKNRLGARVVQNALVGSERTDRAGAVPLGGTAAGPWHPGTTIHAAVNAATHPVNARLRTTHDANGRVRCPAARQYAHVKTDMTGHYGHDRTILLEGKPHRTRSESRLFVYKNRHVWPVKRWDHTPPPNGPVVSGVPGRVRCRISVEASSRALGKEQPLATRESSLPLVLPFEPLSCKLTRQPTVSALASPRAHRHHRRTHRL